MPKDYPAAQRKFLGDESDRLLNHKSQFPNEYNRDKLGTTNSSGFYKFSEQWLASGLAP